MNENRLGELKQAYESIPLPEGLEFRVRSSIAQAKKDWKKEPGRHRNLQKAVRRIWQSAAITAAVFLVSIAALANSGFPIAKAMEQIPVLGAITRVFTFRTYEDTSGNMSAHVAVPQVENGGKALNQSIQDYTGAIIEQYKADVKASGGQGIMNVDLSYRVVTDNSKLFALRFDKTIIMASGNQTVKIYNVDKSTEKIITLDQLFSSGSDYQTPISQNIKEQMRSQMKADPNLTYWLDGSEVPQWDFQSVDPSTTFYVNQSGNLVIVFDEGQVAPMFMGAVEFTIPSSITSPITRSGYLKGS